MNPKKYSSEQDCRGIDNKKDINHTILIQIFNAIRQIKYGSIQIHIQNGKVIQIDKVSKSRIG